MNRIFATLGVLGLASLTLAAPASAAADKIDICHDGKIINIDLNAVGGPNGHSGHPDDIIPPTVLLPNGLNWTPDGLANCVPPVVLPIGDGLPADEDPVLEDDLTTIVDPPAGVIQPAAPAEGVPVQVPAPQEPAPQAPAPQVPAPQAPGLVPQVPAPQVPAPQAPALVPQAPAPAPQGAEAQAPAPRAAKSLAAAAGPVSRGTNQGFNAQTSVGGTDGTATWLAGLGALLGAGAAVAVRRRSRTDSPTAR